MRQSSVSQILGGVLLSALPACATKTIGGGCWGPATQTSDWDGRSGLLDDGGFDCKAACTAAFPAYELMPDGGSLVWGDAGHIECELVEYCTI